MKTLEDRFSDRLKAISGTATPSLSTGETVVNAALLRFKNLAADWDVSDGKVYVTVQAITSVGFQSPDTTQFRAELRQQQSLKTLINRIAESVKMGRSFGGRRASFGGQELTPEAYEWVKHNAAILLRYVKQPGAKSKTPPVSDQLKTYAPPTPLHRAVHRAILDGLQSAAAAEKAQEAAQKVAQQAPRRGKTRPRRGKRQKEAAKKD